MKFYALSQVFTPNLRQIIQLLKNYSISKEQKTINSKNEKIKDIVNTAEGNEIKIYTKNNDKNEKTENEKLYNTI